MCDPMNKKPDLERITEKEKEENVRKQGYTKTFPTKQEVNFALRFETLDLPPYGKESSCKHSGRLRQYKDRLSFAKCPHLT